MEALDSTAVARMGLILGHLLAFALAAVGIAFGDLAIFRKRRVDTDMLATAQAVVKWALYALWATGLAVIWLDTKFDLAVLATKPPGTQANSMSSFAGKAAGQIAAIFSSSWKA